MESHWVDILLSALAGGAVSSVGWVLAIWTRLSKLEVIVHSLPEQVRHLDQKLDRFIERHLA